MFLPIGDAPNPKGVPIVTYALIAANVAAFLLLNVPLDSRRADVRSPEFREYVEVMSRELQGRVDVRELVARTSAYDVFSFEHGYRPASPQLPDLFTCMFLHGSFMHLFGNMLFLWIYGDNVERRLGPFAYLLWYLATGVAATLTHALMFSSSEMPLVGASGAISGVLGFYFVWFPRNVVRMLAFLPPFLLQVFEIPARWVLGMYLVIDNLLPIFVSAQGGVAHGAHIGGFLAGGLGRGSWIAAGRRRSPSGSPRRPRRRPAPRPCGWRSRTAATPRPRRPTSRSRRRTRAACSRPTRPCRSPAGCGRTATPTRRSRCCGASCATSRRVAASPRSTRPWESSCWRTSASRRPRISTC